MNHLSNAAPQVQNQLSAVKSSPIDDRVSSIHSSLSSLESEIESMAKALAPVAILPPNGVAEGTNSAPQPVECRIENALRNADERLTSAWQRLSALRASLRV